VNIQDQDQYLHPHIESQREGKEVPREIVLIQTHPDIIAVKITGTTNLIKMNGRKRRRTAPKA
jgi:hypothetical protein